MKKGAGTKDGVGRAADKAERLAEALRANLRRRKAQSRARKGDAATSTKNEQDRG